MMTITVKSLSGISHEINVMPSDTIRQVKEKVQKVDGTPASDVTLVFNVQKLDDNKTVEEYGFD
jgi:hypothetical protein